MLDQAGQRFHRLDQRQRARAVVDVAAGVVLRPRGDEQDADGRGDDGHVEHLGVRQAPADARGLRALEKVAVAVVEQFPRQAEQERGGFLGGLDVGLGRAGFERRIHVDGEAAPGVIADPRPGVHDVRGVGRRASPPRAGAGPTSRGSPRPCARGPGSSGSARRRTSPDTSAAPPPRWGRWARRSASSARCGRSRWPGVAGS